MADRNCAAGYLIAATSAQQGALPKDSGSSCLSTSHRQSQRRLKLHTRFQRGRSRIALLSPTENSKRLSLGLQTNRCSDGAQGRPPFAEVRFSGCRAIGPSRSVDSVCQHVPSTSRPPVQPELAGRATKELQELYGARRF